MNSQYRTIYFYSNDQTRVNNQGSASVSQTACTITKEEPQESLTLNKLHQPSSSQNQITN